MHSSDHLFFLAHSSHTYKTHSISMSSYTHSLLNCRLSICHLWRHAFVYALVVSPSGKLLLYYLVSLLAYISVLSCQSSRKLGSHLILQLLTHFPLLYYHILPLLLQNLHSLLFNFLFWILNLEKIIKIVEFPYIPHPASPKVNILCNHYVKIKTRELTFV